MRAKQRKFTTEFKLAAVERLKKESATDICKDLKITNGVLWYWKNRDQGVKALKRGDKEQKTNGTDDSHRDAIVYLRHARDTMGDAKKLNRSQLLTLLALSTLEGR